MSDALATVQIAGSGSPNYLTPPKAAAPIWASPSALLSSMLTSFVNVTIASGAVRDVVGIDHGVVSG